MVIGRFFWDAFVRSRTSYGLTDKRAIIMTDLLGAKLNSVQLRNLADVTLSSRDDGSGTITLGPVSPLFSSAVKGWPSRQRLVPPAFEMIPDAGRVYGLIQDAQHKAE